MDLLTAKEIQKRLIAGSLLGLTATVHTPWISAQERLQTNTVQPILLEQRAKTNYDTYILGPGDVLEIELVDLPELSGRFSIGPDGTLYLPRLRALCRRTHGR